MKQLIQQPDQVIQLQALQSLKPEANEVVIKMILSPIHNHNLMQLRGNYGYPPPLPTPAGTEAVGIISQIGSDVKNIIIFAKSRQFKMIGKNRFAHY